MNLVYFHLIEGGNQESIDRQLEVIAAGTPEPERGPQGVPPPGWKDDASAYRDVKAWMAASSGPTRR